MLPANIPTTFQAPDSARTVTSSQQLVNRIVANLATPESVMTDTPPLRRTAGSSHSTGPRVRRAGCRTQLELAAIFDVRQSSISDVKRRGSIPSDWLIKRLSLRSVNPAWIMEASGKNSLRPVITPQTPTIPMLHSRLYAPLIQRSYARCCVVLPPGI